MARIGVIGDLHLDLGRLERTLDGPLAGCDGLVLTGDLLDRGPDDPDAVLDRLLELDAVVLAGNHELAYLGGPRFTGMMEDRGVAVAPRLRDLAIDGKLRAAHAVGDVLCVHGGVSAEFWNRHLRALAGADAGEIAAELNRRFLRAVTRREFSDPVFAALRDRVRGPFWAHLRDDLLRPGLPPFAQVVGHVTSRRRTWLESSRVQNGGRVFPVDWGTATDTLGHIVLTG
jgi:hypothetical protein